MHWHQVSISSKCINSRCLTRQLLPSNPFDTLKLRWELASLRSTAIGYSHPWTFRTNFKKSTASHEYQPALPPILARKSYSSDSPQGRTGGYSGDLKDSYQIYALRWLPAILRDCARSIDRNTRRFPLEIGTSLESPETEWADIAIRVEAMYLIWLLRYYATSP